MLWKLTNGFNKVLHEDTMSYIGGSRIIFTKVYSCICFMNYKTILNTYLNQPRQKKSKLKQVDPLPSINDANHSSNMYNLKVCNAEISLMPHNL